MQITNREQMECGKIYRFHTPIKNNLFMCVETDDPKKFVSQGANCVDLHSMTMTGAHFEYDWWFNELNKDYRLYETTNEEVALWNRMFPNLKVLVANTQVNNHYSIY